MSVMQHVMNTLLYYITATSIYLSPHWPCCLEGCCSSHWRPQQSHYRSDRTASSLARSWCCWSCRWQRGRSRIELLKCSSGRPQRRTIQVGPSWWSSLESLSLCWVCRELKENVRLLGHLQTRQWHFQINCYYSLSTWIEFYRWARQTWADIILCYHLDRVGLSTSQVG